MSNNIHFTNSDPEPGICICSCNYYFWMSLSVSILTLLVFPLVQFIYGVDLRNADTIIEGISVSISDWLLADGLISFLAGIMAMIILKNSDSIPNLVKIIFNTCVLFLFCWTVLGTVMLFSKIPLVIQGLALIYNYIIMTSYIAYFIVSIKYKDYIKKEDVFRINEPHNEPINRNHLNNQV